ncbi:helix-turn-helix domain-containing protein [Aromatoleum toluvorans]|uniref:Helix-turn-helix domain-containing protein n=1 Tax=Aromatoleum toluvorans TaxID=92002 RepID=A0ABX1PZG4_9RHOO|nr:AraC family transcriptional regulator [Aromatoleum toluvorans]NMG44590.1 helix-turn-helix domain-containing protein [Aromatoleum toluvorans]
MDRLSSLLDRFALSARVFYSGTLCGVTTFEATDEAGHLHVVRRGPLQVQGADRRLIDIEEPSLLFYPRPAGHRLRTHRDTGADVVCASVEFGGGLGNPLARALPPLLVIRLADLPALASTLALLLDEAFEQRSGRQAIVDRLCEVVLVHVLRHTIEHRLMPTGLFAGLAEPRLARAIQAMHAEPARKWSLEELAARAGMSRARFAVNFRETVGQTPLDYLTDWRIGLAQTLLRKGKPVKIVAEEVGYGSTTALSRAFSTRLGASPMAWARRER